MNSTPAAERRATTGTETEKIAQFTLGLDLTDVPQDVVDLAKDHLLDALGIAIASSGFDFGRISLQAVRELGDGRQCSAIGSGTRMPPASAALLNGILAHGLDFDDTHITGVYHASAPALAAVLAAGQAANAGGAEILLAFIAGIEVGCRLAIPVSAELLRRGFHPTAVCGTFATAAAAGRLHGLSMDSLVSALGICGSQASGVLEITTSWLKRMHPGWSAHSGLAAVALARAGFLGPNTMLEGPRGFYVTHTGAVPPADRLPSFELGTTWHSRGIALKPYPCCHLIHPFVDAALELRGRFAIEDIERIDCPLTADMHASVAVPREACIRPANPYRALFSVPYVVALSLVRGKVDLAAFYDEPLDVPDVLGVASKVWCGEDPQSDYPAHFPGEVIVRLKDGRVLQVRKPASLGTREFPLSRASVMAKFISNATRVISAEAASRLADRVLNIECAVSLDEIMALSTAS